MVLPIPQGCYTGTFVVPKNMRKRSKHPVADTKKTGKVQPIAADNPAEQTIPPTSLPPPSGRGRPPGRKDPVPKQMSFFDRLAKIDKQDWGTRAQVRVYRLEPIIDRLRGSERKYIRVYQEPLTEEQLKVDNGSGRYRLYLNYKAAAGPEQEIDSVEIDILDMKFPPQIPLGEWVDDPRNKRWGWAKAIIQQQAPQPPQPAAVLENAYETVLGIQDRERDRMGEKTSSAQEFASKHCCRRPRHLQTTPC